MSAFIVADEIITDPDVFEDYKREVLPLIERFGGRFLSRGADVEVIESGRDWTPGRMVILEFPDMETLKAWYDCPEYREVRELRLRSANTTLVALGSGTA